jgi:phosphoglycolate phosphatase-like HAD superfamily hydrolase
VPRRRLNKYQHVPQGLIRRQLREWGVEISSGQLNRLIIDNHDGFHEEKAQLLRVGLEVSSHINVDDTGARHQGKNGYCTHIGNEWFAWFSSTESKSRINFLELLQAGQPGYVVDELAREYMRQQKLPQEPLALLSGDYRCTDKTTWEAYLTTGGIRNERHRRIATEGALVGSLVDHGIASNLVIMSDDAGQFTIAGFLNALCWVHAERTLHKLIAGNEVNRQAQEAVRGQIWTFYQQLKAYQQAPDEIIRQTLEARFDEIFTQKTAFHSLNRALHRLHNNKTELLLVLERPEIPLHNNLSENDIRDYVKKRKISATTRSDTGRKARDTFLSLKKTCQKLGLSFSQYLFDRISRQNHIPPLPELVQAAAQGP